MASSPTSRSLAELRRLGFTAAVTERWNPHSRIRQDLFGFVDVLAVGPQGTLAVQATSQSNVSSRLAKIQASPYLAAVIAAGWSVEVWGWSKRKLKRGGKAMRWTLTRTRIVVWVNTDELKDELNPEYLESIPTLSHYERKAQECPVTNG